MAYVPGRGRARGRGGPSQSYGNRNFSQGSRDGIRNSDMRHPPQGNFYGDRRSDERRRSPPSSTYDRKRQGSPNRHSPPHKKSFDSRVEDQYRKDRDRDHDRDRDRHESSRRSSNSGKDQKRQSDARLGSGLPDTGGTQNMADPRDPSCQMNDPRNMMSESQFKSSMGNNAPSYPSGHPPLFPSSTSIGIPKQPAAKPLKSILKKKSAAGEASNTPPSLDDKPRMDERSLGPGSYGSGAEMARGPGVYGSGPIPREEYTRRSGSEQMFDQRGNHGRGPLLPGMSTYIDPDDEEKFLYGDGGGQRISRDSEINRRLSQSDHEQWMQPSGGRSSYNTQLQDRNIPASPSSYGGSNIASALGLTSKGGITALSDESMSTIQAALASLKQGSVQPSRTQELSQQRQADILSALPNISSNLLSGLGNLSTNLLSGGISRQQSSDPLPGLGGQSSDLLSSLDRVQSSHPQTQVETSMRFGRENEFDKYQISEPVLQDQKKDETTNTIQNILQSIGFDFGMSKRMQELAREKEEKENKSKEKPITIDQTASFLGGGLSDADLTAGLFKRKRSRITEPEEKKKESPELPIHTIESVLSSQRSIETLASVPQPVPQNVYPHSVPVNLDPYAQYAVPSTMPYLPENPYNAPPSALPTDYYSGYPPTGIDPACLQLGETIPFKRPKFDGRESISSERLRSRTRSRSTSRSRSNRRSSSDRSLRGRSPSDHRSSRRESSDVNSKRRSSLSPRRRNSRDRSPRRRGRSPGRRISQSPSRRSSKSPNRKSPGRRSRSPGRWHSSPGRGHSRSPGRRHSSPGLDHTRSPGRRHSRSPGRRNSRSPGRRHSRSPGRRHNRSPGRRHSSPGKRDSRRRGSKSPRRESRDGDRHGRSRNRKGSKSRDDHERYSRDGAPRGSSNDRHDFSIDRPMDPAISDFRIEIGTGVDSRRVLTTSKVPEPKREPSPESTRIVLMPKTEHIRKITVAPKVKSEESSSKPTSKIEKPEIPPEVKEKLKQEHDERQKKLEILEKEMEKLRKQQNEIMRKRQRQKDGHKDPLLTANSKLQEEISEQIKALRKASLEPVDISNVKVDPTKEEASTTPETQKNQKNVKYIDKGRHWCKCCNEIFGYVVNFCQHLKTKGHLQKVDPYDRPWVAHNLHKVPPTNDDSLPREPISGVEFIMSVDAFYCSLCNTYMGDATSTEAHLKDHTHNKNYKNYVKKNPFYEKRWNLEKKTKLAILKEEKEKAKKKEALARIKSNQEKDAKIKEKEKKWNKEVEDLSDEKKGVDPKRLISDAMVKKAQKELKLKLAQVKKDKDEAEDDEEERKKGMFTWKKEGKLVNKPAPLGEEEESVEPEPAKPTGPKLFLPNSFESHFPVPGDSKDSKNSNKNPKVNYRNNNKTGTETEEKMEKDKKEKLAPIIIGRRTRSKGSAQVLPSWTPVTRKIPGQKDTRKVQPQPQSQQQSKSQAENPASLDKFLSVGKAGEKALPVVSDLVSIPLPPAGNRPLITAKTQQEMMAALEQKKMSAAGVVSAGDGKMETEEDLKMLGIEPASLVPSVVPKPPPPVSQNLSLPPGMQSKMSSASADQMHRLFYEESKPKAEENGKDVLSYDVPMELDSDASSELPSETKDSPKDNDSVSLESKVTKEVPVPKDSNEGKGYISSQGVQPQLQSTITKEDSIPKESNEEKVTISSGPMPIEEVCETKESEVNQNVETSDKQVDKIQTNIQDISNRNAEKGANMEKVLGEKIDFQELKEIPGITVKENLKVTVESIDAEESEVKSENDKKEIVRTDKVPEEVKDSKDKEINKESTVGDSEVTLMEITEPTAVDDAKQVQEPANLQADGEQILEETKVSNEDIDKQVITLDCNTDKDGQKALLEGAKSKEETYTDEKEDSQFQENKENAQEISVTCGNEGDHYPAQDATDKIEDVKEQDFWEKGEQFQGEGDLGVVDSSANFGDSEDQENKVGSSNQSGELESNVPENYEGTVYSENQGQILEDVIYKMSEEVEDIGCSEKHEDEREEMTVVDSIDQENSNDADDLTILDLSENIPVSEENSAAGNDQTLPVELETGLLNPDSDNSQNTIIMVNPEELANLADFNEDPVGHCVNVSVTEGSRDLVGLSVSLVENFSEESENNKRFDPCLADSIADETASLDVGITVLEASDSADQEDTTICPDEFKGISLQMTGEEEELDISDGASLGSSVEMGSDFEVVDECEEDQDS